MLNAARYQPPSWRREYKTSVEDDLENYRVVVLGGSAVGKTSLLRRFFRDSHNYQHIVTLEDLYKEKLVVDNHRIDLDIIDTSGTEDLPAMRRQAIEKAHAIVIVYALNDKDSFAEAEYLRNEVLDIRGTMPPTIIVGNKADLCNDTSEDRLEMCDFINTEWGHRHVECSARDDTNVGELFEKCIFSELYSGDKTNTNSRKISLRKKTFQKVKKLLKC